VVHVHDASRAVGVTTSLLSDEQRGPYAAKVREEYAAIRVARADPGREKRLLNLEQARANKAQIDLSIPVPVPTFTGARTFNDWSLADIAERIDWTPFFQTWELAGHYPAILEDPVVGSAARSLYADAQELLHRIVRDGLLQPKAAVGFWPATSRGEEIDLWVDESQQGVAATLHMLRQQFSKKPGRPNRSLADYVAPAESGVLDYVGLFAVTTGHGLEALLAEFAAQHDDYSAIMCQALADRLAEAFAERMHEEVRRTLWGYAPAEALDNAQLIGEAYQGIRPAPGYPACPVHSMKETLFALLGATERAGMTLTESWAMLPAASVSGLYFWRPEAEYFGVGQVGPEQG
jgi:5-methyltetrahydrofolate--homocysteine methyltransferase